ncbi:nucleoside hydrolase [Alicyclobacillus fodiniaquatilis]|uniref:Nucleoside hydrolase n=1 Tax=Alicyclobacillus fodiniaquatilis TaxID=1661150 RepID=A0ABW4JF71_9BACL
MYATKTTGAFDLNRLAKLAFPKGKVRMVLDTDTYNEIDDQFAVTYALLSPERLKVEALYAAPFYNDLSTGPADGMEKSYEEILRILERLHVPSTGFVYRGSTEYLPDAITPVKSDAARDLVERALASDADDPLYVVAIGAPTNVASAILMEPKILHHIVVVWLGGNGLHWPDTREFNMVQDIHASRVILDSGVPLVYVPCMGVTSHLLTSLPEIRDSIGGYGEIGDYLVEVFERCHGDHFGYSRVIWDIATIAYFMNEEWVPSSLVHSPILNDGFTYSFDSTRHLIRAVNYIHRDPVFTDLFTKIRQHRV